MKGFFLLAFNNSAANNVMTNELENEIKSHNIRFRISIRANEQYDNIIGYQLLKDKENENITDSNHLIAGDIYGPFGSANQSLLNYAKAIELLNISNIAHEFVAFEGNLSISSISNDKIIFQNDLEGYRKIFYYYDKNILCVSTYLSLILKAINKRWNLRRNAAISFICSRESKWPLTFVEEIFTLPPLSRAQVTREGILISSKTFSNYYKLAETSKNDLKEQLYSHYKLIIQRKRGENTAVTLSGGYDSNCLTKLYSDIFSKNFTAVSVGYESKRERDNNIYNETIYAERIAQKLGIPFEKYFFNQTDFFSELRGFIDAIDQPGHDPSSNYIMNKYLGSDGFDLVVNGMGGDANFADKRDIYWGFRLSNLSERIGAQSIRLLGKRFDFRGPFKYCKFNMFNGDKDTFHDLFERSQIFNSAICSYVDKTKLIEIDNERKLRSSYFQKLYTNALSLQEIIYSLALFSNPDEYHALTMAERNNIEILMPFVNTNAALMMMNGSYFKKVTNRQFEMKLFGGISNDLLAKSKSGLSIPYSEWLPQYANSIFEYYNDLKYFNNKDFDLCNFQRKYQSDETFSKSSLANIVIWKLLVLKEFIQRHQLCLQ